jgi:hypothetical protein
MPQGGVTFKGRYFVTLYGPGGDIKAYREGDNVVTRVGKEFLASFLYSAAVAASTFTGKYLAIGTDTTAESDSDTAMNTEVSRHTSTVSYVSNQIVQITATFATGSGTGAITEYGLFTSNTAGTMISRDIESVITKGASDTLKVVYQLTFS